MIDEAQGERLNALGRAFLGFPNGGVALVLERVKPAKGRPFWALHDSLREHATFRTLADAKATLSLKTPFRLARKRGRALEYRAMPPVIPGPQAGRAHRDS